jgi:hypothetical protein
MPSRRPRPRRLLLPIILAGVLAAEITGLAIARSMVPSTPAPSASGTASPGALTPAGRFPDAVADDAVAAARRDVADQSRDPLSVFAAIAHARPAPDGGPGVVPLSPVRSARTAGAAAPSTTSYRGRNHVWIPSLRINRSVSFFPCSRSRKPDNYVYSWGCAGRNNVYLMGHAYSVFKPLHDAYVGGRLRKGMWVVYADGAGRVHTYSVIWWRLVAPTGAASWAWAAQSRPSMTLQTCVGSRSQYRLMVRLVRVG